jgi:hypothetical protein
MTIIMTSHHLRFKKAKITGASFFFGAIGTGGAATGFGGSCAGAGG